MMDSRNSTLDIFKGLACIGVLFIHCLFPQSLGKAARSVGCVGVPLFFCISGYYLAKKNELDVYELAKKIRHIVELIICSEAFYLLFSVFYFNLFSAANRARVVEKYFYPGSLAKFFVLNQPPIYAHLWFLYALVSCYISVLIFFKNKKQLKAFSNIVPVLLFCIVVLQEFSFLHIIKNGTVLLGSEVVMMKSSFFLFRAVPFFLLGFMFREYNDKIKNLPLSANVLIGLIVVAESFAIVEGFLFSKAQFYLGNIVALFFIMFLSIKSPNIRNRPLQFLGSDLSTYVYVLHVAVFKAMDIFLFKFHLSKLIAIQYIRPILALVLTILLSIVIKQLINVLKHQLIINYHN